MEKTIDVNGKEMKFAATAMTDHMADKIFGINLSYALQHSDDSKTQELMRKIAFIMYKRAELGGWRQVEELSVEDYYDWLDGLDSFAIEQCAKEILDMYVQNKKTSVSPKNITNPQAG